MAIRALLTDIEGVLGPLRFLDETLTPYANERLGSFLADHCEDEEIEIALEEAGRLMGGFELKPEQAEALLLRWTKQGRKPTPLKIIQAMIWQEGYDAGALKGEIYPDVEPSMRAWKAAGLSLFTYSSNTETAQKLWLGSAGTDVTALFDGFFDTRVGQKVEDEAYKAIARQIGLTPQEILVLSGNEDELDAAKAVGCETMRIVRAGEGSGKHPAAADLGFLTFA